MSDAPRFGYEITTDEREKEKAPAFGIGTPTPKQETTPSRMETGAPSPVTAPEAPRFEAEFSPKVQQTVAHSPDPQLHQDILMTALAISNVNQVPMATAMQQAHALMTAPTPEPKGLGKAMVDRWKLERLQERVLDINYQLMMGGEQEALLQERQEIVSQLPELQDVLPAYPENIFGRIATFGRKTITGATGITSQMLATMVGSAEKRMKQALAVGTQEAFVPPDIEKAFYGETDTQKRIKLLLSAGASPLVGIYRDEAGAAYGSMVDAGLPHEVAKPLAQGIGGLNLLVELAGTAAFVAMFPGADRIARSVLGDVAKKLGFDQGIRNIGLRMAAKAVGAGLSEVGEELVQETVSYVGQEIGSTITEYQYGMTPEQQDALGGRLVDIIKEFLGPSMLLGLVPAAAAGIQRLTMPLAEAISVQNQYQAEAERAVIAKTKDTINTDLQEALQEREELLKAETEQETLAGQAALPNLEAHIENLQDQRTELENADTSPTSPPNLNEAEQAYKRVKNEWLSEREERIFTAQVEGKKLQQELETVVTKKEVGKRLTTKETLAVKQYDQAVQLYIDTKRNPAQVEAIAALEKPGYLDLETKEVYERWEDIPAIDREDKKRIKKIAPLTQQQQEVVDLSRNLPPEVRAIADKIDAREQTIGQEALDEQVIANTLENHVNRIWQLKNGKELSEVLRKFGTKSRHARARVFDTIVEGWVRGYELRVKSATQSQRILQEEMAKVIPDKRFLTTLQKLKSVDGEPLVTTQKLPGYVLLEHPNIKVWRPVAKAEEAQIIARGVYKDKKGMLFTEQELYAHPQIAQNVNNMLGTSALWKLGGVAGKVVRAATKYNAIFKSWILMTSLFHHQAFLRSTWLPSSKSILSKVNFVKAYKTGRDAVMAMTPEVKLLVRNGMTIGIQQEWDELLVREGTIFGKVLDKIPMVRGAREFLTTLRQKQTEWLFNSFGTGLKTFVALNELKHQVAKYPNEDPNVTAQRVASMMNDDFGGLNLVRLGRNPTLQHVMRLLLLAPDWTESNVRTMVKAFGFGKEMQEMTPEAKQRAIGMYQAFWGRAMIRGLAATALLNFATAGGDVEKLMEGYKEAWGEKGQWRRLRWLDWDVTALYEALGDRSGERKYFSILGHFRDPIKFATNFITAVKQKGAVIPSMLMELGSGTDWAGRKFTTIGELVKGEGTVKWEFGPGMGIQLEELPSYIIEQLVGVTPIQMQNAIALFSGEMNWVDMIANDLGLGIRTKYK